MVISETKLEESFPNRQFKIPGYALPFRSQSVCWWDYGFCKRSIPSRLLSLNKSIESLFIELNFRKEKLLLCCTYNTNRNNI